MTSRNLAIWLLSAIVVAALVFVLRSPDQRELEAVAEQWFTGLQQRDWGSLAEVDAAAPAEREGPAWEAWKAAVAGELDAYERERESGHVAFDEVGYKLVRATMLGAGTFWQTLAQSGGREQPRLRIKLNFGYGEITYGELPRGTTIYLLGVPAGRIHPIVLGRGEVHQIEVLRHLQLTVNLRRSDRGPSRYRVERASWVPGSEESVRVKWAF